MKNILLVTNLRKTETDFPITSNVWNKRQLQLFFQQLFYKTTFGTFEMTKQLPILVILAMVIMTITTMTSITTSNVNAESRFWKYAA